MSSKLLRYILFLSNLLLIFLTIIGIVLSYYLLTPKVLDEVDYELGLTTIAFVAWGVALIVASICFIGIIFTKIISLHLFAALLLCYPLALSVWLVLEQFLYRSEPNWWIVGVCLAGSLIWLVQVFCELLLACLLCCQPKTLEEDELDEVKENKIENGTDDEKEKLVIISNNPCLPHSKDLLIHDKLKLSDDCDDDDETAYCEDRSIKRYTRHCVQQAELEAIAIDEDGHELSNGHDFKLSKTAPPQELPLATIPEERQHLLSSSVQCPLATPEDTGV